jgi:hypothetical protein
MQYSQSLTPFIITLPSKYMGLRSLSNLAAAIFVVRDVYDDDLSDKQRQY